MVIVLAGRIHSFGCGSDDGLGLQEGSADDDESSQVVTQQYINRAWHV
jgi:hypothetical protein